MLCLYYHVTIPRSKIWFVVGCFRSEDNIAFERALKEHPDVLEFFVPKDNQEDFLTLIKTLQNKGFVASYQQLTNRIYGA